MELIMRQLRDKIIKSRCGGRVERCHTMPHHGSYSNASHSWGVAMLMHYLWPEDFPRLAIYCLSHDIGEGWVGDIPAPTYWAIPGLREQLGKIEGDLVEEAGCPREDGLAPEDFAKLKACDRLELYIWCCEQQDMGNNFVLDCMGALTKYFHENPMPEPAQELFKTIQGSLGLMVPVQQGVVQRIVNGSGS